MDFNDIKKNSFLYPVGTADTMLGNQSLDNSWFQNGIISLEDGFGHTGVFHEGNPYFLQLKHATTQQDRDALYELAVKWEAQQADYAQQLGVNYAVLQEQRQYDSPSAVIARQRAAGINPDIASGSSSGSSSGSATMQTPQLSQVEGQTKFKNYYDDQLVSSQWLSAITGIFGGIASIGSTAIGAIDTLTTLPARRSLLSTQAELASKTLPAMAQTASNTALAGHLSNVSSSLGIIGNLSSYFTPDSTDEDIANTLSVLGYNQDQIPGVRDSIRHFHQNPKLQKQFTEDKLESSMAVATSANYSIDLFGQMVALNQQLEFENAQFQQNKIRLQDSLTSYLNNSSFAKDTASNLVESAQLDAQQIELQRMQVERDTKAYLAQIDAIAGYYNYSLAVEKNIITRNGYYKNGKDINGKPRKFTADEKAMIDAERIRRLYLSMAGSQQVQEVINLYTASSRNAYNQNTYTRIGTVTVDPTSEARKRWEQFNFQSIVNSEPDANGSYTNKFYKSLIGSIPIIGGVASDLIQ